MSWISLKNYTKKKKSRYKSKLANIEQPYSAKAIDNKLFQNWEESFWIRENLENGAYQIEQ